MNQTVTNKSPGWVWGLIALGVVIWLIGSCHPSKDVTSTAASDQASAFPYDAFDTSRIYVLSQELKRANVRSGPGQQYDILRQLTGAENVVGLGITNGAAPGWLVIDQPDGKYGYIKLTLISWRDKPVSDQDASTLANFPTSFDCLKVTDPAEKLICQDSALAKSDLTMASLYSPLLGSLTGEQRKQFTDEQKHWIADRDRCALDADPKKCLSEQYQVRILTLQVTPLGNDAAQTESESAAL